jgi:hypothetical protein
LYIHKKSENWEIKMIPKSSKLQKHSPSSKHNRIYWAMYQTERNKNCESLMMLIAYIVILPSLDSGGCRHVLFTDNKMLDT